MKIFISIGMHGRTEKQIQKELEKARKKIKLQFGEDVEIIDNFSAQAPEGAGRLWYLGEAIKKMDGCDYCYFVKGWINYKGCIMEEAVCKAYGIKKIGSPE